MKKTELARGLGISRQMVYKLMDKGMPVDNLENAQAWRNRNINLFMAKHHRIDGNSGTRKQCNDQSFNQLYSVVANMQLDLEVSDAKQLYRNARAMKEKYLALRSVAEYEKLRDSLISRVLVEKFISELASELRERLTACARRLSPIIVGKNDIAEIEAILSEECRQLLKNFADSIATRNTSTD